MIHKEGIQYKIKNISYEDAKKRVKDKLGMIRTKEGIGLLWTKSTKSTYFLDKSGTRRAVYNHTVRDFWWIPQFSEFPKVEIPRYRQVKLF